MVRHLIIADTEAEVDALHADEVYRAIVLLRQPVLGLDGYRVLRHRNKNHRGTWIQFGSIKEIL